MWTKHFKETYQKRNNKKGGKKINNDFDKK